MKPSSPIFESLKFVFKVIEEDGGTPNLYVEFYPIGSCGYHVRVYRNNLMIGDYIHSRFQPLSEFEAKKYIEMAYDNPVDYSQIWTSAEG